MIVHLIPLLKSLSFRNWFHFSKQIQLLENELSYKYVKGSGPGGPLKA